MRTRRFDSDTLYRYAPLADFEEDAVGQTNGSDEADRPGTEPGTPRWVKISWIIAAIVVVLILAALLFGREHGPGMHSAPSNPGHMSSTIASR